MKAPTKFLVYLFAALLFSSPAISQVNDSIHKVVDSSFICLAKISLNDGTKLWGVLLRENETQVELSDFNTGVLILNKSQIKTIDSTTLDKKVLIETNNGTSYFGRVMRIEKGILFFESDLLGKIEIPFISINKITLANAYLANKDGTWFTNPNATRYFFAPSAIPLKKREGYYQNAYLLANSVNVGLTNNFTVGGGVVIPVLFYVTPKISYKVARNMYLGGGVLFTQSFISDLNLSAGIGYGLVTWGNTEHNLTIGSGYGFAKNQNVYKETPWPIITLNGMTRVGKKLSLITENWFIPRRGYNKEISFTVYDSVLGPIEEFDQIYIGKNFYTYALSLGLRFMPGIKTSIDFSVVAIQPDPITNLLVLPYLDFVYKFD